MKKIEKIATLDDKISESLNAQLDDGSVCDDFDEDSNVISSENEENTNSNDDLDENDIKNEKKCQKVQIISSLEDKLTKIQEDFTRDVTITVGNLKEKSMKEAVIKGNWASRLLRERVRGTMLKRKLTTLCAELRKMYSEDGSSAYLSMKRAADSMIDTNADVQELRQLIADNQIVVDFLEKCWDTIRGFGFTIKNSIESTRLELGI